MRAPLTRVPFVLMSITHAVSLSESSRISRWCRDTSGWSSFKWPDAAVPAGIGTASQRRDRLIVSALLAVNAFGDVVDASGPALPDPGAEARWPAAGASFGAMESTTIGMVVTNAALTKTGCFLVAQSAHDGLARAIEPAHTTVDGDAIVAAALGEVEAPVDLVRFLGARAVAEAVRSTARPNAAEP